MGHYQVLSDMLSLYGWMGFAVQAFSLRNRAQAIPLVIWGCWAGPNQALRDIPEGLRLTGALGRAYQDLIEVPWCMARWGSLCGPSVHTTECRLLGH